MSRLEEHPSRLELDRAWLGAGSPETTAHLGRCERCSAWVARLEQPVAVPGWVSEIGAPRRRSWLSAGTGLVAAGALSVLLLVPWGQMQVGPSTQAKGTPAVALYVQRDGVVALWDGQQPVAPGDSLRLKVVPEGLRFVVVAAATGSGTPLVLFQGEVRGDEELLPESWRVDASPEDETMVIVRSRERLDATGLPALIASPPARDDLWLTRLVISKRAAGSRP